MDSSSYSNIHQLKTKLLELDVFVNFSSHQLSGTVTISFEVTEPTSTCVLDTNQVEVKSVDLVVDGSESSCKFSFRPATQLGSALEIELGKGFEKGNTFQLKIQFLTSPNASGIQWLDPGQTDGKEHPYLFTQFQAIHCRSFIPCQDSPSNKAPYKATVHVDSPLVALMSALSTSSSSSDGKTVYTFHQPVPIPTYLIALVVGNLQSRELGPRSRIWSEKEKVELGEFEFSETESFLKTAEDLLTPYEWGRYDLLLLPGSFPYGGMENPCLTFITPTLLAGDRSLSGVVAHEIAHSWMGNLVTSRTWEHFWLNEGFTVFIERKILGRLNGENYRHFQAILGHSHLQESISHFGETHTFTRLVPELNDSDPDDAFSSVPYEKGFQFLWYLETLLGIQNFEAFLKEYVKKFQFQSIQSNDFKSFFISHFEKTHAEQLKKIDWDAWFYKPGLPTVDVQATFDKTLANNSYDLALKWASGETSDCKPEDIKGWSSAQIVSFLTTLRKKLENKGVPLSTVQQLNKHYSFSYSKNSEIRFCWSVLCIQAGWIDQLPAIKQFLGEQGRMKFVRPLYRELVSKTETKEFALNTFEELKSNYHEIAKKMISSDLQKFQKKN